MCNLAFSLAVQEHTFCLFLESIFLFDVFKKCGHCKLRSDLVYCFLQLVQKTHSVPSSAYCSTATRLQSLPILAIGTLWAIASTALHRDVIIDATAQSVPMPRSGKDCNPGTVKWYVLLGGRGQILTKAGSSPQARVWRALI